ncbi:solute carrier organic anion transporter family member 4C1 [Echinops telfairi]|uniref:Solute carrier organic anion transporter family member 4C1 n=1 Tax=Echinops telfairi TaxID=9371 RepID=A0AC55CML5_ECHTE|nr:solute carrier organic anion transporter family member 4C1 [Echinops telfairi]
MNDANGIENPAFVPSSPDTPRRWSASPGQVEVSARPFCTQKEDSPLPRAPEPAKPSESPEPQARPSLPGAPLPPGEQSEPLSLSEFEEGPCGWGNFHPESLQRCNTPQGYLLHYCLLALIQGIVVNGLVNISISTIEKRYEMKSSLTGLISSSYDISFCVLSLFVSFFGEGGHKPRWLAFASFMIGLGALVFSLPQFFSGKYQLGSVFEDCASSQMNKMGILKSNSFGNECSNMIEWYQCASITEADPRWLGAWWIGFLLSWIFAWSLIIPFSCFPKHLPGTEKIQAGKICQAHQNSSNSTQQENVNFGKSFKDFPAALKNLTRNTVFMCLVLSTTSEALITTGFATFLPKFIENQFGISSSFAATLGGAILIPGAALGQILGGVLVSKFKLECKNTMKFSLGTSAIALLLSFVFIFAKCENEPFAGVSESYNGTGELGNLTAPCNANCNCLRSYYYPVCGEDGIQYFSPCFAGCIHSISERQPKRMPQGDLSISHTSLYIYIYKEGVIDLQGLSHGVVVDCKLKIHKLSGRLEDTAGLGSIISKFKVERARKCVNNSQRSLALGIQFMLLRLLGTIPGPIIFGTTIDSTCVLWDINECGVRGACWVYNNIKMAHMLLAITVTCKVITIFFNGLAIFLYKPPPSRTEVLFQNQNSVVTTVSVTYDSSKEGNED